MPPLTTEPPASTETTEAPATTEAPTTTGQTATTEAPATTESPTTAEASTTTAEPAPAEVSAPLDEASDTFPRSILVVAALVGGLAWFLVSRRKAPLDPRWRAQALELIAGFESARDGLVAGARPAGPVPDAEWTEVLAGCASARGLADTVAADAPSQQFRAAVVEIRDTLAAVELEAAAARSGAPAAAASLPLDASTLSAALAALRALLGPDPTPPPA